MNNTPTQTTGPICGCCRNATVPPTPGTDEQGFYCETCGAAWGDPTQLTPDSCLIHRDAPTAITPRHIAEHLAGAVVHMAGTVRGSGSGPYILADTNLSEGAAPSLCTNVADETGPNGGRTFITTVREVDPAPEVQELQVRALARSLQDCGNASGVALGWMVARDLAERLILTGAVLA